jgi:hypothetical protein
MQLVQLVHFLGGADGLADLEGDQFADQAVAIHQREHEGRDGGPTGTEGVVLEEVEDFVQGGVIADPMMSGEPFPEFVEPVHHDAEKCVRTCSMRAERLPLSSTTSPSRSHSRRRSAQAA